MAVNGGHTGTKKGPNWGHVKKTKYQGCPCSSGRSKPWKKWGENTPNTKELEFLEQDKTTKLNPAKKERQLWTGQSCFSNRALVKTSLEVPKCLFFLIVSLVHQRKKNWEHSGQEGIRKYLLLPNSGYFPWKISKVQIEFLARKSSLEAFFSLCSQYVLC